LLFLGGPSGSGKTSLAQKMANIIGCEVVSLESYYKPEQVRDYKYDDYSSLDIALLTEVMYSLFGFYANIHFKRFKISEHASLVNTGG
jgi:uridine kinase